MTHNPKTNPSTETALEITDIIELAKKRRKNIISKNIDKKYSLRTEKQMTADFQKQYKQKLNRVQYLKN